MFELTDDEAVIVVEDDLFFSPDLMEFFLAGYHVLRADPSLWCVSAWNDNGFGGLVADPKRLLRTGFFPGLGWLLTRRLYEEQLEPQWPNEHWDHWMRSETKHRTSRGRECLYPQVPRTFHHGSRGTFMNPVLHSRFFAHVALSSDPRVRWPAYEWDQLRVTYSEAAYDTRLRQALADASPLTDLRALLQFGREEPHPRAPRHSRRKHQRPSSAHGASNVSEAGQGDGAASGGVEAPTGSERGRRHPPLALWYEQPPRSTASSLFREIATLLGIWHEMRRGSHRGVHELACHNATLLIVNLVHGPDAQRSPYADLAPASKDIFRTSEQLRRAIKAAFRELPGRAQTAVCRTNVAPARIL